MKVGLVRFLNAAPFHHISFPTVYDVPSILNEKLRNRELAVAFASSIEYLRNGYDYLPGLCLAAHGTIGSVHLYLQEGKKIEEAALYLDPASNSSNALLEVLMHHYWKCPLKKAKSLEQSDGYLLIGDEALRRQKIAGFTTYDLGELWYELTALPFVFALFLKHPDVESAQLERELNFSLERFSNNFEANLDLLAHEYRFPRSELERYFKLCHYRLGEEERAGLHRFGELYNELHTVCT